jgi:hypothetical protein
MSKMTSLFLTTLVLVGFASAAFAEEETSQKDPQQKDTQSYFLCKSGAAVRTIRVEQKENQACHTYYTKEGIDKMVGKSGTADVCLQVANKIKINLEAGNWKCRDISQTRVSSSVE